MAIEMTEDQEERLTAAMESIAHSLARWVEAAYPERKEVREAIVTHIPTEEDKAREKHGGADAGAPIEQWAASTVGDEVWIGERERRLTEKQKDSERPQDPLG